MDERPVTYTPIGLNKDGDWVNYNNKCTKCGHPMPLPEMNGKHCKRCGTLCHVPSPQEVAEANEKAKKECPKCGYRNSKDANFCIKCGTKLDKEIVNCVYNI